MREVGILDGVSGEEGAGKGRGEGRTGRRTARRRTTATESFGLFGVAPGKVSDVKKAQRGTWAWQHPRYGRTKRTHPTINFGKRVLARGGSLCMLAV